MRDGDLFLATKSAAQGVYENTRPYFLRKLDERGGGRVGYLRWALEMGADDEWTIIHSADIPPATGPG